MATVLVDFDNGATTTMDCGRGATSMTDYHKGRETAIMDPCQNRPPGPPDYHMGAGSSNAAFEGHGSDPMSNFRNSNFRSQTGLLPPNGGAPRVVVTRPVVVGSAAPLDTTYALVMSALSAVFCNFWCGTAGILVAWRAKLHVLDKQYEHARLSLLVSWLFVALACLFGAVVWITMGCFIYYITRAS